MFWLDNPPAFPKPNSLLPWSSGAHIAMGGFGALFGLLLGVTLSLIYPDPLWVMVSLPSFFVLSLVYSLTSHKRQRRAWSHTYEALPLKDLKLKLKRARSIQRGWRELKSQILVLRASSPPDDRLILRRKGEGAQKIGDRYFDELVEVLGPREIWTPLLDHKTRKLLRKLMERYDLSFSNGALHVPLVYTSQLWFRRRSQLLQFAELTRQLNSPKDPQRALQEIISKDPKFFISVRALSLLPEGELRSSQKVLLKRAKNSSQRLQVAVASREAGREILISISEDEQAKPQIRVEALTELLKIDPAEVNRLDHFLRHRLSPLRALALSFLGSNLPLAALLECIPPPDNEVNETLLKVAEERLGEAEPLLIQLLPVSAPALRQKIAGHLGERGSVQAVAVLLQAKQEAGIFRRGAFSQAIEQIQSRIPGAFPGQLTMAEGEGGELSLVETGRLSLVEGERFFLSEAPGSEDEAGP